jgi:hypothetical protein
MSEFAFHSDFFRSLFSRAKNADQRTRASQAAEKLVHQKVLYQGASLRAPQAAQNEYRALAPCALLTRKDDFSRSLFSP